MILPLGPTITQILEEMNLFLYIRIRNLYEHAPVLSIIVLEQVVPSPGVQQPTRIPSGTAASEVIMILKASLLAGVTKLFDSNTCRTVQGKPKLYFAVFNVSRNNLCQAEHYTGEEGRVAIVTSRTCSPQYKGHLASLPLR